MPPSPPYGGYLTRVKPDFPAIYLNSNYILFIGWFNLNYWNINFNKKIDFPEFSLLKGLIRIGRLNFVVFFGTLFIRLFSLILNLFIFVILNSVQNLNPRKIVKARSPEGPGRSGLPKPRRRQAIFRGFTGLSIPGFPFHAGITTASLLRNDKKPIIAKTGSRLIWVAFWNQNLKRDPETSSG
jgi:hypothetical protein